MTRRFSVVAFCSSLFVCLILALVISRDFAWLAEVQSNAAMLKEAERTVMLEVVFIMAALLGMVVNLIFSYSRNLTLLFNNETRILENVSRGDLSRMVPVATWDEFGVIAGHTNTMIEGLRHRTELLQALKLADDVQKSLLPRQGMDFEGADIAGDSIYCTEAGGDYYDYFRLPEGGLGVVVADVSGHGVSSALHMATARAHLIAGVQHYAGGPHLIQAANRFLTATSRTPAGSSRYFGWRSIRRVTDWPGFAPGTSPPCFTTRSGINSSVLAAMVWRWGWLPTIATRRMKSKAGPRAALFS